MDMHAASQTEAVHAMCRHIAAVTSSHEVNTYHQREHHASTAHVRPRREEVEGFAATLAPHQMATLPDGSTVLQVRLLATSV